MKLTRRPLGWQEPEGADRQTTEPEQSITQTPERDPEKEQTMMTKYELSDLLVKYAQAQGNGSLEAQELFAQLHQEIWKLYDKIQEQEEQI